MKNRIKVSVIIPVYRAEKYLQRCINSVIQQTLKEIEIIFIEHDSNDNSLEILYQNAEKDFRIRVYSLQNVGVSESRNFGSSIARGEYLYFMDADDEIHKKALEIVYKKAKSKYCDVVVFGAKVVSEQKIPSWIRRATLTKKKYYKECNEMLLFNERGTRPFVWNKLYKRKFWEKNGIHFPKELTDGEDQFVQFMVFSKAKKVYFISNKLYKYYYLQNDSAMNRCLSDNIYRVEQHLKLVDYILNYLGEYQINLDKNKLAKWYIEIIINDLKSDKKMRYQYQHIVKKQIKILGISGELKKLLYPIKDRRSIIKNSAIFFKEYGMLATIEYSLERIQQIIERNIL